MVTFVQVLQNFRFLAANFLTLIYEHNTVDETTVQILTTVLFLSKSFQKIKKGPRCVIKTMNYFLAESSVSASRIILLVEVYDKNTYLKDLKESGERITPKLKLHFAFLILDQYTKSCIKNEPKNRQHRCQISNAILLNWNY